MDADDYPAAAVGKPTYDVGSAKIVGSKNQNDHPVVLNWNEQQQQHSSSRRADTNSSSRINSSSSSSSEGSSKMKMDYRKSRRLQKPQASSWSTSSPTNNNINQHPGRRVSEGINEKKVEKNNELRYSDVQEPHAAFSSEDRKQFSPRNDDDNADVENSDHHHHHHHHNRRNDNVDPHTTTEDEELAIDAYLATADKKPKKKPKELEVIEGTTIQKEDKDDSDDNEAPIMTRCMFTLVLIIVGSVVGIHMSRQKNIHSTQFGDGVDELSSQIPIAPPSASNRPCHPPRWLPLRPPPKFGPQRI
jgi:hypothetical protein